MKSLWLSLGSKISNTRQSNAAGNQRGQGRTGKTTTTPSHSTNPAEYLPHPRAAPPLISTTCVNIWVCLLWVNYYPQLFFIRPLHAPNYSDIKQLNLSYCCSHPAKMIQNKPLPPRGDGLRWPQKTRHSAPLSLFNYIATRGDTPFSLS